MTRLDTEYPYDRLLQAAFNAATEQTGANPYLEDIFKHIGKTNRTYADMILRLVQAGYSISQGRCSAPPSDVYVVDGRHYPPPEISVKKNGHRLRIQYDGSTFISWTQVWYYLLQKHGNDEARRLFCVIKEHIYATDNQPTEVSNAQTT